MELSFKDFESLIKLSFTPKVLVVTTPEVDEVCKRNNCQITDYFQQYSKIEGNVLVRSLKEETHVIQDFGVRFLAKSELKLSTDSLIDVQLYEKFYGFQINPKERYGECIMSNFEDSSKFLSQCKIMDEKEGLIPWYDQYQYHLLQNIGVSEHEFFSHPIACIFVVASHEDTSVDDTPESFVKLYDSVLQMPELFKEGFMDVNFLRYHVLLKDGLSENDHQRAELKLSIMRQSFGHNTCMITLNSLMHPTDQFTEENYDQTNRSTELNREEQSSLENFQKEFIFNHLIRHIEQKVISIDETLSSRKGIFGGRIKNIFKSFGGKQKHSYSPEINARGDKVYPLSHPSVQARQLADLLFFIGDFDSALQNYKYSLTHFKNEKATKYWAGSLEMIAICSTLLDSQRRDGELDMERAISAYDIENQPHFATRASFILIAMKKFRSRYLEAAAISIKPETNRASNPLLSGLFQEHAAFCYLYRQPKPMIRMFTMRLILAADKYFQSGLIYHGLGCALAAYPNYQYNDWTIINNHLQYGVGRGSYLLGDLELSLSFLEKVFVHPHPFLRYSPEVQSAYLREYLYILNKATGEGIREAAIPSIKEDSVTVVLNSEYSNEGEWKQMEDWLAHEDARERSRKLFKNFTLPCLNYTKHNASVVGENILICCVIQNPLEIPIQLYSIQIFSDYFDPAEDMLTDGTPASSITQNDAVIAETKDLFLPSKLSFKLSLSIQPTKIGLVEIRGVAFNIGGIVWGKVNFPIKKRRIQITKDQIANNRIDIDYSLCIQVVSPMPLMIVSFPSFGDDFYHGEIRKFLISFKNEGKVPLTNVKVKIGHPSFFVFSSSEHVHLPFPIVYSQKEEGKNTQIDQTYDLSLIHLPIGILQPDELKELVLWVRGASIGQIKSNFLFYYEPINIDQFTELKYRLHKEFTQLNVLPLLNYSVMINPSLKLLNSYILILELKNSDYDIDDDDIEIIQISSVSASWKIEPITNRFSKIKGRETMNICCRLVPSSSQTFSLTHSNHLTGNREVIIDSSATPIKELLIRSKRPAPVLPKTSFNTSILIPDPSPSIITSTNRNNIDILLFYQRSIGNQFGFIDILNISTCPASTSIDTLAIQSRGNKIRRKNFMELKQILQSKCKTIPSPIESLFGISIRNPLRYFIDSPLVVEHNFSHQLFCIVPIKIHVLNPSLVRPISFTIDLKDCNTIDHDENSSNCSVFWDLITSKIIHSLPPGRQLTLAARVGFTSSGYFDINRLKFSIYPHNSPVDDISEPDYYNFFCRYEHLIFVKDVSFQ